MHMEKLIGEMKVLEDEESRLELEAMKEWSDLGTSVGGYFALHITVLRLTVLVMQLQCLQ